MMCRSAEHLCHLTLPAGLNLSTTAKMTGYHASICTCMKTLRRLCEPEVSRHYAAVMTTNLLTRLPLLQLWTDVRWKPEITDDWLNAAWPTGFRIRLQCEVGKVVLQRLIPRQLSAGDGFIWNVFVVVLLFSSRENGSLDSPDVPRFTHHGLTKSCGKLQFFDYVTHLASPRVVFKQKPNKAKLWEIMPCL